MLNLNTVKTPGVYIDEVSLLPPSVAGVETGIPAFIGYTEKDTSPGGAASDLKFKPVRLTSMLEFEELFGGPQAEDDGLTINITDFLAADDVSVARTEMSATMDETKRSKHILYYSMQLFFANGGGPCYVISNGVYSGNGQVLTRTDYDASMTALKGEDEPTMIVIPEAVFMNEADQFGLYQAGLDMANELKDRFVLIDVKQAAKKTSEVNTDIANFRTNAASPTNNRQFGAAYYPYLATTIDYNYTKKEGNVSIVHKKIKSDGTAGGNGTHEGKKLNVLEAADNLLYKQLKNVLASVPMTMPPSPAIAGIYAKTDAERGVWKAPANVGVAAIVGPAVKIDDSTQSGMNVDSTAGKSVNAIRTLTGRGTVVWGARTMEGNDNEWRYVPVRRFFNFVEESVKKATYRFVFEPNDANTWVKVRGMIENFLTLQWRNGALQGVKPEHAFFVRVGLNQTMSPVDILEGRMIVEIGMAVVRPAEFIILRFMHKMAES